jgi:hypothetical protein
LTWACRWSDLIEVTLRNKERHGFQLKFLFQSYSILGEIFCLCFHLAATVKQKLVTWLFWFGKLRSPTLDRTSFRSGSCICCR